MYIYVHGMIREEERLLKQTCPFENLGIQIFSASTFSLLPQVSCRFGIPPPPFVLSLSLSLSLYLRDAPCQVM